MAIIVYVLLLISVNTCKTQGGGNRYVITVDGGKEEGNFPHFWESTGFCPPEPHQDSASYFLSDDMKQNLMHIASVPHQGIKQVRMHWLLDLIKIDNKKYNFTFLDELLTFMRNLELKPGFELMGNPSNKFRSFDDEADIYAWRDLVAQIASRYINMFGLDWVKQWNFETWNEPDHNDFDVVNMTVNGFLNYYDACSEGLLSVDKSLTFGGPGGSCRDPSFSRRCWALFQHCINGTNFITSEKGSRINFISFHKKGGGTSKFLLQEELVTIEKLNKEYKPLYKVPIFNDEADPLVGWSKPLTWRADATYAAIVVKIIAKHQNELINNPNFKNTYGLLGNDNGFLSFYPHQFTQRTLLARFQINNTHPHHVRFVKKPVMAAMLFLSKLGTTQIHHTVEGHPEECGSLAYICKPPNCLSNELVIIVYDSFDTNPDRRNDTVQMILSNFTMSKNSHYLMSCTIDMIHTNSYSLWQSIGSPAFPSVEQFVQLDKLSQPKCTKPVPFDTRNVQSTIHFELSLPGVVMYQICKKYDGIPPPAYEIQMHNITTGVALITWKYPTEKMTKCVKTFQVLYQKSNKNKMKVVNEFDILYQSYTVSSTNYIASDIQGIYHVIVIDFWGRKSKLSKPFIYN